jgi:hypothetical protein
MNIRMLAMLGLFVFGYALFTVPPVTAASGPYYATPAWNQTLPATTRFITNMDGAAVLDRETGLTWAQSPAPMVATWQRAMDYCTTLTLGGRKGWRLPTVEELASLVDVTQTDPSLPGGHPFSNVRPDFLNGAVAYWTSSTYSSDSAWVVDMHFGGIATQSRGFGYFIWPVRGGK